MDLSPAQLLLFILLLNFVAVGILTFRYSQRRNLHSFGTGILVFFAWLVPIIGPICLAVFLAGRKRSIAT